MSRSDTTAPVSRRNVLKTAGWSVPVIAAAAAAPSAAASVLGSWRVSIGSGCLPGVIGADPTPSFIVQETENRAANRAHEYMEFLGQEFSGTRVFGSENAAQEHGEDIVGRILQNWTAFRTNTALHGRSSAKIHYPEWPELTDAGVLLQVVAYGQAYGATVSISARRTVVVDPLSASERVGWGYHSTVLTGEVLATGITEVLSYPVSVHALGTTNTNGGVGQAQLGRDSLRTC